MLAKVQYFVKGLSFFCTFPFDPLPLFHTLAQHHTHLNAHPAALTIRVHRLLLFALSVSGDAGKTQSATDPGRRMYTVLPPPADYKTDSEKSVTLAQLESINSAEDPAGKTTIINIYVLPMCTIKLAEIYGGVFLRGRRSLLLKSLFWIVSATPRAQGNK